MKAFIFVALVASVAARSLDLKTLNLAKEQSLVSTPVVSDDLLLKEQLINQKQNLVGQENFLDTTVLPVDKTVGGIYDYSVVGDRVLSIEELYTTQLFKEYLQIPLFRQYIQYPSFQRFVQSVYFQKFWTIPTYKTYFFNPVLFYKYVYPIVQLFNTEINIPTTAYGQEEDVLGLKTLVDNVLLKNKNVFPYAYNRFALPSAGLPFTTETTNYKFLLDKLYKNLYVNKPVVSGDFTEVKTDVKIFPTQEKTLINEPKIVDVQVDQRIVPVVDTIVPFTTDNVVLTEKNLVILKDLLRQQIITEEVYQNIVLGKIDFTTVIRQVLERKGFTTELIQLIINRFIAVDTIVPVTTEQEILLVKELLRQKFITPEIYQNFLFGKFDLFTILRQVIISRDVVDTIVPFTTDSVVLTEKNLVILKDLLRQQIINQEVYQNIVLGKIDFVTVLRQVLERKGFTTELIQLIINRFVAVDTIVPVTTEQEILLVKELLRQKFITPEIYQNFLFGKFDLFTILRQVIISRDVVDTLIPVVDTVVLTEKNLVILKDLLRQQFINQEVYQAIVMGKIDFTTVLRQVLERKGVTTDLIQLIISRLFNVDTIVPVTTEQDVLLVKDLLRQKLVTPEVYQTVLVGKVDLFTILRQVIISRDIVDTIIPVVDTVVLTERQSVLLKELLRNQIISQDVFEAVLLGKVDFFTVLRQVLVRKGLSTELVNLIISRLVVVDQTVGITQQDVLLLKELLRENLISYEIYQAVVYGKIDFFTVLRQIIFRRDVVDTIVPYNNINRFFGGNDRFDFVNKFNQYKNMYNTEVPTFMSRDNMYNRYPIVA